MPATHYANNAILDYQFHGSFPSPYTPYVGLSATLIDKNGLGATEPEIGSATGYYRYSGSSISWNFISTEGTAYNSNGFYFPICNSSWGTITEIFITTGDTSGSILYHAKLSPSIPTYEGTQIFINPQTLFVTERI